nr:hypothetical protein BaRGS_016818 [Batillaria attramentaria]
MEAKDPESTYLSFANPNYCFEDQINSNQDVTSPDEDGHDGDSLSLEKLTLTDTDKHVSNKQAYANRGQESRGILGYLAMLEAQAKERETHPDTPDSPDDGLGEPEEGLGEPEEGIGEMSGGNSTPNEKFEEGTDINSPDSNDSGIHSDTRSDDGVSHVKGPVNEDIYAVVNKKRNKDVSTPGHTRQCL